MLINGRYQILHPLQEGGFGHTFLAEDTQLPSRRRCVIKQLKPIQHNPEFYKLIQDRFQREAAIQETLGEVCPQIPRLYAYFSEGDRFYLVEEWVDGDTLRQKVADVGCFSEAAVREYMTQLLMTIETVHQYQIIHRDIKPDNVIIRKRDGKPVLIDFGAVKESMATVVNSKGQTARSIVIGTAGYMAPEQSAGRPVYASDLYSLGLTAIYLLTGKSPAELDCDPHSGQIDWRSQAPQTSAPLAQVIDTAIQMHPSERFPSASSMRQALQVPAAQAQGYETTVISRPQPDAKGTLSAQLPHPGQGDQADTVTPTHAPTHIIAPVSAPAEAPRPPARREWIKPLLIGGGIGSVLLLGIIFLRAQPVAVVEQPQPSSSASGSMSPTATVSLDSKPSAVLPLRPSPSQPESPAVTSAATCGDTGGSGQNWYPVFINHADLGDVQRRYCQDAIAKIRDNGTPAVQVASFTDRPQAIALAQKVGGDVGLPYQIGATQLPSSPAASVSPSPASASPPAANDGTNAVIVGNKGETNIRRGPGTGFGVQHIAFPGDRVKILASDQDAGGYVWYKVYFPKSSASGWIAGQLLQPD